MTPTAEEKHLVVELPKVVVLSILASAAKAEKSLYDLLDFNIEHRQWDLLEINHQKMLRERHVYDACIDALLP